MAKLKFVFGVDTEADFYYNIPSPHFTRIDMIKWKVNKILGYIYKYPQPSSVGIKTLVNTLKKYEFPAVFCITGHLYLKECKGHPHFHEEKPKNPWYHSKIGKDWYYWDKGSNSKESPGLFFGDFIEKEMKKDYFKFGLHGFAHEALTLENEKTVNSIISSGIEAAKRVGVKIDYFAAPFEMINDIKRPDLILKLLKENKINKIIYSGDDEGFNIKREFKINRKIEKNNLELIWISNYFEGSQSKKKIDIIINEIRNNIDKEGIYCLMTHDFTHKNAKNVERILNFVLELKKQGKIELLKI